MALCGLHAADEAAAKTDRQAYKSSTKPGALQLAQLSPLLTQLVGQPKDFSLSTTAYYKSTGMLLNLLQKPVFSSGVLPKVKTEY